MRNKSDFFAIIWEYLANEIFLILAKMVKCDNIPSASPVAYFHML